MILLDRNMKWFKKKSCSMKGTVWGPWNRDVVVITIVQLKSTKPELRFCADSNLAPRRVGHSRWWGSQTIDPTGNKAKRLLLGNRNTKTTHHHLTIRANNRINDYEISLLNLLAKDGSLTAHHTNIQNNWNI